LKVRKFLATTAILASMVTMAHAEITLQHAEASEDCRAARGEIAPRPFGSDSRDQNLQRAKRDCNIFRQAAIDAERRKADAEQAKQAAREQAIKDEQDRIIADEEREIQDQQNEVARQKAIADAKLRAAEMQRTYDRQMEEARVRAEAKAIEDAKPINVLFRAYTRYVWVDICHQNREGYLMVFINDVEMERAEKAIHAIIEQQKQRDPNLDTDLAYNEAVKEFKRMSRPINGSFCKDWAYNELLNMSPAPAYVVQKPQ
jgi:hypothetical protein